MPDTVIVLAMQMDRRVEFTEPIPSSWNVPQYLHFAKKDHHQDICKLHKILTKGECIAPPCDSFRKMKLLGAISEESKFRTFVWHLKSKCKVILQHLLGGRDMTGVAFVGSGKTFVFTVPLIMIALELELELSFTDGEGPARPISSSSLELAC